MEQKIKTIFELLELFAADQDVQQNSCNLYIKNIRYFIRWCQANNINPELVQKPNVIEYKRYLENAKLSSLTIDSRITSLRKFFKWTEQNDYYTNIVEGIRNPKKYQDYKKDPLTVEQIDNLYNSIDCSNITGKRDFAIINLMMRTGFRTVEVERLNISDIEPTNDGYLITVTRKGSHGNKTKFAITEETFNPINDYLETRNNTDYNQPLFITTSYYSKGTRIKAAGISKIIHKRLIKAGIISDRITAHSFRHTVAFNLLKAGLSLRELQLYLGHTSPNTTQLYIRALDEQKRLQNIPGKTLDEVFKNIKIKGQKEPI